MTNLGASPPVPVDRFAESAYEVEYVAQIGKVDVDKLVAELNAEIQSLQDALDEFNFNRSVNL